MARARVVIEVTPSRLEVAVVRRGLVTEARSIRHDTPEWAERWPKSLEALAPALLQLASDLGAAGGEATILCSTPTEASTVHTCPKSAGRKASAAASELALANVCASPLDTRPLGIVELGSGRGAGATDPVNLHTLAVAEDDVTSRALVEWAAHAGLEVTRIVTADAVATLGSAASAVRESKSEVHAALWMGEYRSVLSVGSPTGLRFVRPIAIGVESLVDALTRAIPVKSRPDAPVTLDRATARLLLGAAGVPQREQVVDAQRGLDGAAILPLLQPVLQRLAVEIKQSLRFGGLSEQERTAVQLNLMGAGAALPGLADVIARQALSATEESQDTARARPPAELVEYTSARAGPIAAFVLGAGAGINLLPREQVVQSTVRRTKRFLRVGVAVCGALVAGEGGLAWFEMQRERNTAQRGAGDAAGSIAIQEHLVGARDAIASLERRVGASLGESSEWAAVLALSAQAAPESLKIVSISFQIEDAGLAATLTGIAEGPDAAASAQAVKRYMDGLGASPLLSGVHLKQTQRGQFEGREQQRFVITTAVVGIPSNPALEVAGAAPRAEGE